MPFNNGNLQKHETVWTKKMIRWLKKNHARLTNKQLADGLGLRLTVTRNKCAALGLKRIEMEYWTKEQVKFLIANYKTKGDVEIAEIFEKRWPKNKKWVKQHICKKRKYLKLKRTAKQIFKIASKNSQPGGNSFTIDKNSSSKNMHPMWVAQRIAWRDPELQKELVKHPEIIEAGKTKILLNRAIKKLKDDTKGNNR